MTVPDLKGLEGRQAAHDNDPGAAQQAGLRAASEADEDLEGGHLLPFQGRPRGCRRADADGI